MKSILKWCIGLGLGLLILIWHEWPDGKARIVMCDVGQGDAFIIYQGFSQVLIDTGEDPSLVLACLGKHLPFWDRQLELVFISHPQADHYGALIDVLRRYRVNTLVDSGIPVNTPEFIKLYQYLSKQNIQIVTAMQGQQINLGNMRWKILWPEERRQRSIWADDYALMYQKETKNFTSALTELAIEDPNTASVVVELTVEGIKTLFTGDIGETEELALIADRMITDVDVLKVAHHGSKTSSSQRFLDESRPEVALIGVGQDNRFGHPNESVLHRLEEMHARVYRTDLQQEIILILEQGSIRLGK